ncbi:unknown [Firmicutes bacterium CAG:94]|nr:unknown [Firmicutes bacterium CAG:94]
MEKKRKTEVILSLSLCVVSFFYAVYLSSDLLFRDFITCEGVFQKYNRARYELVVWDVSFEIDGETSSFNLMNSVENIHSLVPGGTYKITYAKRTNMLLSISPYQP